jgi:hypothetical protein
VVGPELWEPFEDKLKTFLVLVSYLPPAPPASGTGYHRGQYLHEVNPPNDVFFRLGVMTWNAWLCAGLTLSGKCGDPGAGERINL